MKKSLLLSLLALIISYASFALTPIVPSTGSICIGATLGLYDTTTGGVWSSSNVAIATVGASTGIVTGVSSGVVTITYTLGSSYSTGTYTVSAAPATIVGAGSVCVSSSITLSDATPGGIWSSSSTYVATIGSATGVVTGSHAGVTTIYYTMPGGCSVTKSVTVDAVPTGTIVGPSTVCAGGTITLIDSTMFTAGIWSSSNPSIATVGTSTGIVTGVSAGTVTITLTTTGTCGSTSTTTTITVTTTTSPGTISGPSTVVAGSMITLTDGVSGGTWSSAGTGIATVGASSGVVTGVSAGTTTITYTVSGCSGPVYATTTITVTAFDGISGHVLFGSGSYYGNVKIWLIHYDGSTHMLSAVDSASLWASGTSLYYQFAGIATDSYRVKAATIDTTSLSTGYIPTYHTSAYYWHAATVINHTSGTSDINKDINMSYGTVTTGPGFIAGDVLTGANKGTTGGLPVIGLKMVVINSTTSQIMGSAYTDASGNYSFSNLPVGQTYFVFPDSMNYLTTPYSAISLTAASPSKSAASFIQHTVSKTITPIGTGVINVKPSATTVSTFPNPTSGNLYIQWNAMVTETANVTITDIAGNELYNANFNMNEGSGMHQISLSELANGLYLVNVKSATINYNNKIQVQH